MSNFSAIGLDAGDPIEIERLIVGLMEKAREDAPVTGGIQHVRWRDASGASIAFHMKSGDIQCVTPFFEPADGLSRWRVRTSAAAIDERSEALTNDATGGTFRRIRIATLPGSLDVVTDDSVDGDPAPGAFSLVRCWLVARPTDPPPPPPARRSWWPFGRK